MIAIKTTIKQMPEYCDDCQWYSSRPHPHKGWTELCEIMSQCMDDDQPKEWIYDGNGRPEACPLVEVCEREEGKRMKITEDSINHNAVRIIKELVDTRYDLIAGEKDIEPAMAVERGYFLMTLGEIGGVLEMAEELKKVLKA